MKAVEFTTELGAGTTLRIPDEIASRLPKSGRARVILLTEEDVDDADWRNAAYQQFLREDPPEDAIYDACR